MWVASGKNRELPWKEESMIGQAIKDQWRQRKWSASPTHGSYIELQGVTSEGARIVKANGRRNLVGWIDIGVWLSVTKAETHLTWDAVMFHIQLCEAVFSFLV